MNHIIVLSILASAAVLNSAAQTSNGIQWEKNFGGADADFADVVKPTSDGGYILGGYSYSDVSGTKTSVGYSSGDFWVVKLDAGGNKQWDKCFGGTNFDGISSLQQTTDGGYVLAGTSYSGVSGNKSSASAGFESGDYWVVKLDGSGNKQWEKCYGGTHLDQVTSLQQTSDGGYIIGGTSFSGASGNKTSASQGSDSSDYWVARLDASGNKQWDKSFGGSDTDELHSLQQTTDGGYILGGTSFSGVSGNKTAANRGNGTSDYWVVKLDASGNKQWDKSFGGDDAEALYSVQQISGGGYILGGHSYSGVSGNKSANSFGSHDYWVVKLDANGNKQWDRSCGGADAEELYSVLQTSDGGYLLGGISYSTASGNKNGSSGSGLGDYWIVKLDANGNKQSEQSLRGSYSGKVLRLQRSGDAGSVLAGLSSSSFSPDLNFEITKLVPPLSFTSVVVAPGRVLQMRLPGISGMNYILQASTNLTTWRSLLTNSAVNGVVSFSDSSVASLPKRFYRVQPQ